MLPAFLRPGVRRACLRAALAIALSVWATPVTAQLRLVLEAARITMPGGSEASGVSAACSVQASAQTLRCVDGTALAVTSPLGALRTHFDAAFSSARRWELQLLDGHTDLGRLSGRLGRADSGLYADLAFSGLVLQRLQPTLASLGLPLPLPTTLRGVASGRVAARMAQQTLEVEDYALELAGLGLDDASGAFAAEGLSLRVSGSLRSQPGQIGGVVDAQLRDGQAYIDPIFADLSHGPVSLQTQWWLRTGDGALTLQALQLQHAGVGRLSGSLRTALHAPLSLQQAELSVQGPQLGPLMQAYLQPLLVATRFQDLQGTGAWQAQLRVTDGVAQAASLQLSDATLAIPGMMLSWQGLDMQVDWRRGADAPVSTLRWLSARVGELPVGPTDLRFRAAGMGAELLQPAFVPILDGGLQLRRLRMQNLDSGNPAAVFEAGLKPIELAALCRVLGWPEFGGSLSGELPGLSLRNRELRLQGGFDAEVFDGQVRIEQLRVIDPFGRVPRLLADIRLRNLELGAMTSAFEVGRMDGRLDGEIADLRLLDWQPVAFRASFRTPPGDRSRHRISQRAVNSIASLGGGAPSKVLSRSVLRFFDEFRYARLGLSCELRNGVCEMDGLEPKGHGYVIVKGRGLPRIDVVGYEHRVDWATLLEQLKSLRNTQNVRVE